MAVPTAVNEHAYVFEDRNSAVEYFYNDMLLNTPSDKQLTKDFISTMLDAYIIKAKIYGWDGEKYPSCTSCGKYNNKDCHRCKKIRTKQDKQYHEMLEKCRAELKKNLDEETDRLPPDKYVKHDTTVFNESQHKLNLIK